GDSLQNHLLLGIETLLLFMIKSGFTEKTHGDSVHQTEGYIVISQWDPVVLNCSYKSSFTAFPFWYVQYPNGHPKIFLRDTGREDSDEGIVKGFNAEHDEPKKSFHMWKPSSELSDSATYYCIARDTVTRTSGGTEQKARKSREAVTGSYKRETRGLIS
uniref:Ig-like domain-containing protein n=1 Tax=Pelusios castaneus TaxID=367368 RepID=A0A8C8SHN5_9SAUR